MSNRIFIISDTHFGHKKICEFESLARPFASLEEHDGELIGRWNSVVRKNDTVCNACVGSHAHVHQGIPIGTKLYTAPPNTEQIERRVAEACAELVLSGKHDDDPYIIARQINKGKWKEYLK